MTKKGQLLEPYRGVIRFCVVLIACHFAWKFTVLGGDTTNHVTFLGMNISAPFVWVTNHLAQTVLSIVRLLGFDAILLKNNLLVHANLTGITIVTGCSGIKQAFIFTCIILFARGQWKHKLWFIPLGILVCFLVNIIRIATLAIVVKYSHDAFLILHEYVLKYLFYGIIFLMWVIWEEKISKSANKSSKK